MPYQVFTLFIDAINQYVIQLVWDGEVEYTAYADDSETAKEIENDVRYSAMADWLSMELANY